MAVTGMVVSGDGCRAGLAALWRRELDEYPGAGRRAVGLSIVVLTTVLFYYQYYLISGVGAQVIAGTGMSFTYFVNISVISAFASALSSVLAGVTDRYGRANIVTVGVLACALICLVGFPFAHGPLSVGVLYALLGAVEGLVLVATPALVRDFSPQVGRASAMGFWTIGPVAGSLIVSVVVSNTVTHLGAWQDQYLIAGLAGLGVFVVALFGLRELSPRLRDQTIVSERDRALVEARAKGLDVEAALDRPLRQMLHVDIVGSAVAISLLLIIYFIAVGFFPIFFQTIFGYSTSKANAVGDWMWGTETVALIVIGWLSDRVRVRKPFMFVGAVGSVVMTVVLISRTGHPGTGYHTFVLVLVLLALSLGMAFAPWMAGFTETIERRNPALTGTGLSVWGLIIRLVVAAATFIGPYVVNTVTVLVAKAPAVQAAAEGKVPTLTPAQNATVKAVAADPAIVTRVKALAARYAPELATAARIDPGTQQALSRAPGDRAVQAKALSELSGEPLGDVTRVLSVAARYAAPLATAQAIDPVTQLGLLASSPAAATQAKAVAEIAAAFHTTSVGAAARLAALGLVPTSDLIFMSTAAPAVLEASTALTALGRIPAPALATLDTYGPSLQNPKVVAVLEGLARNAPAVERAVHDSPRQWQHYFWIAVAGEIVFLPLIFLMAGYWDPRKARKHEADHDAMVRAELAELGLQG